MNNVALLFNGVWSHYVFATAPKYRDIYQLVYVHDLTDAQLAAMQALVIPFQSNQDAIAERKGVIYRFLAAGNTVFVEGDSRPDWLDAQWEDRPVNNYWWVEHPNNPPVADTNVQHPVFRGLLPRHACWHTHGAYTRIPSEARVVQRNGDGEIVSWETNQYGGCLFATTLDGIVEQGVQQITHLDNFCDNLTEWLSGVRPSRERMTIDPAAYGITTISR
jgi:hypothetical protein